MSEPCKPPHPPSSTLLNGGNVRFVKVFRWDPNQIGKWFDRHQWQLTRRKIFLLIFNLSIRQRNKDETESGRECDEKTIPSTQKLGRRKNLMQMQSTQLGLTEVTAATVVHIWLRHRVETTLIGQSDDDDDDVDWYIYLYRIHVRRAHNGINNIHRIFSIESKHKYVHTLVSVVVHVGPSAKASTCKINHNMH